MNKHMNLFIIIIIALIWGTGTLPAQETKQMKKIGTAKFKIDAGGVKVLTGAYGFALVFAEKKVELYLKNKLITSKNYADTQSAMNNFIGTMYQFSAKEMEDDTAKQLAKSFVIMQTQCIKMLEKNKTGTVSGVVIAVKGGDSGFARLGNNVLQLAMGKIQAFDYTEVQQRILLKHICTTLGILKALPNIQNFVGL